MQIDQDMDDPKRGRGHLNVDDILVATSKKSRAIVGIAEVVAFIIFGPPTSRNKGTCCLTGRNGNGCNRTTTNNDWSS